MRFLQRLSDALARFMYGRYGYDKFNIVLLVAGLVLGLLANLPFCNVLSLASTGLLIWALFRALSRNITARGAELDKYLRFERKWKGFFSLRRRMWRERQTHKYFHCKYCRAMLRVPRGRGKVDVRCPRCNGITKTKS